MVNTHVMNEVVPSLMQICLELRVHRQSRGTNKFDYQDEATFLKVENDIRASAWFKNLEFDYQHYKKLDVTNLMEVINHISEIKNKTSLYQLLNKITKLRNEVTHNREIRSSPQTLDQISEMVREIVENLFGTSETILFLPMFQKKINNISNKFDQKKIGKKIIDTIKQSLHKEIKEKWVKVVIKSMEFITLPLTDCKVPLSHTYFETDFEVISDTNNDNNCEYQSRKSFPCTDIFSLKDVSNVNIIEGDPGSGKSTFLKKVCLDFCTNNNKSKFKLLPSYSMMFHFNCKEIFTVNSFWQYFEKMYTDTAKFFPEYWVMKTLRELKTIIAIDGLDECNETSKKLVTNIIYNFANFEMIKFLITTRPGFSDDVVKQFDNQNTKYCVLNIKPIQEIKDQEKLVKMVLKGSPNINAKDILTTLRGKQIELKSHFVRPSGLVLFIALFHKHSIKIKQFSHELGLMQLATDELLKNLSDRIPNRVSCKARAKSIMEMMGQYSLQSVQNQNDLNEKKYEELKSDVFEKLHLAKDDGTNVSVDSLMSCVFQQKKLMNETTYNFLHEGQREYLASKILTEELEKCMSGTVLEILQRLTSPHTTVGKSTLDR